MSQDNVSVDAAFLAQLNDLLRIDRDAEEAYRAAIDALGNDGHRRVLRRCREDHRRHIAELTRLIRRHGGRPLHRSQLRPGPFTWGVRAVVGLGGDREILSVLRANEEQVRDAYRRHARAGAAGFAADLLRRSAEDEERHFAWVGEVLSEAGVGTPAGPWPEADPAGGRLIA